MRGESTIALGEAAQGFQSFSKAVLHANIQFHIIEPLIRSLQYQWKRVYRSKGRGRGKRVKWVRK